MRSVVLIFNVGFRRSNATESLLVLLRHKFHCDGLIDRVQHGHRDKRLTMATVSLRRRVAMEFGMWRSVLSGGAAGSIIFGKARRLEVRGGTRF